MDETTLLRGIAPARLRSLAHANLLYWAETRSAAIEVLGSEGSSVTERMRQRAHGGGASTRPNRLTGPERQASAHDRTLRVEQAVLQLSPDKRAVLRWKYLRGETVSDWARQQGLPQRTAADRAAQALLEVGRDLAFGNQRRDAARSAKRARENAASRRVGAGRFVSRNDQLAEFR